MRIANRADRVAHTRAAGAVCVATAWMLAVIPSVAQDQRTGVSHPDASMITTSPDSANPLTTPLAPKAKPSAAVPATAPGETVYGPYVPYNAPGTSAQSSAASDLGNGAGFDPDANIVTAATAGQEDRRLLSATNNADPDAGIVTYVPSRPGEIPDGTLVKAKLREKLSTLTTTPGTKFTATISEPVMRDGRVIVPIGAVLEGSVTWVRGGRRIGGPAEIHLEPRAVILPDGAQYMLRARVVDTDRWDDTKVDNEGTILRRDYSKKNLVAMSLATGSGVAAGAMIGGLPGAVIGAGVGAGVSTVVWLKQDHQAELPKDLGVVFSLTEPMSVVPVSASITPAKLGAPDGE